MAFKKTNTEMYFTNYLEINDSDTDIRTREVTEMMTDYSFATGAHYEASQHSL